jgi:3-dehydroquinate dehydratase-2
MAAPREVLFLNGRNLNMLGTRQPEIYGYSTLADLEQVVRTKAASLDLEIYFRRSNSETALVTWIQKARKDTAGIVINAAAYTHTSVAIIDALLAFAGPISELHLSNNFRREHFGHTSFVSLAAKGIIEGFGSDGYEIATCGRETPQSRSLTQTPLSLAAYHVHTFES